jgi:hypothetical protein
MYDTIMNALMGIHSVSLAKPDYAFALKAPAIKLWESYQAGSDIADNAGYHDEDIRAVYLLRYYPYYTTILNSVLSIAPKAEPKWCEPMDAALFGAGPAPEIVGLAQFLLEKELFFDFARFHVFDINNIWGRYRLAISKKIALEIGSIEEISTVRNRFDLRLPEAIKDGIAECLNKCEIVTFQNCLNEVNVEDVEAVSSNIIKCFHTMRRGATMVIVVRGTNYDVANSIIDAVSSVKRSSSSYDQGIVSISCRPVDKDMPPYLLGNLFFRAPPLVHGLTLSREMKCVYLVAKRG